MAKANTGQKSPFPLVEGRTKGYKPDQVDVFITRVKRTYEQDSTLDKPVTSDIIRQKSFSLIKNGYDPRFVDAALDRLEEVIFERERRAFQTKHGIRDWEKRVATLSRELAGRMKRDPGKRFNRRSIFASGYRMTQVDAVIDQLAERLDQGLEVRVNDVRTVRFFLQRRGYDEAQVDSYLDAVVEYLLSQR